MQSNTRNEKSWKSIEEKHREIIEEECKMNGNHLEFNYSVDLKQEEEILHYDVYTVRVDNLILYHFIMIEDKACALPELLFFMKESDKCEALEHAQNMLNNQYNIEKIMKQREDTIQKLKSEILTLKLDLKKEKIRNNYPEEDEREQLYNKVNELEKEIKDLKQELAISQQAFYDLFG